MEVEALHEGSQTRCFARYTVQLDPAPPGGQPQRNGGVLEQAEQGAELLLLLGFSARVAEQAHTLCEARGEVIEGRHGGRSI